MEDNVRVLCKEETEFFSIEIKIDQEELNCFLSLQPKKKGEALAPVDLLFVLEKQGIVEGIINYQIEHICQLATQGKEIQDVLVAEGKAPLPGPDGWLEFCVNVSTNQIYLSEEDSNGTVNLKSLHLFANVSPGDLIGIIHEPENGEAGVTVTGLPILPLCGKPLSISFDESVHLLGQSNKIIADIAGRVVYQKECVSISEDYLVEGDVDYHVGNIHFSGVVDIQGDVLDDFTVVGSKGITVAGVVRGSRLESDGDIIVDCIAGKKNGFVKCGGNLIARSLIEAYVECQGDVIVSGEIRSSIIKSGGVVTVTDGHIIGGDCIALKGIEAACFGSYLGVTTKLTAGVHFAEYDVLRKLKQEKSSLDEQIENIQVLLGSTSGAKKVPERCRNAVLKRLEILKERYEELIEKRKQIVSKLRSFQYQKHKGANAKINVGKMLEEGVVVNLGDALMEITDSKNGPLSLIENNCEQTIFFLPLTKLGITAEVLQEKIAKQERGSCENT
jgi:hypothetical protein